MTDQTCMQDCSNPSKKHSKASSPKSTNQVKQPSGVRVIAPSREICVQTQTNDLEPGSSKPAPVTKPPRKNKSSKHTNTQQPATERLFRVVGVMNDNKSRYLFQDAITLAPSPAIAIYESFLSKHLGSPNTVEKELRNISLIFTWAKTQHIDIEQQLLLGEAPSPLLIRTMAGWLMENTPSDQNYNHILLTARKLFSWFVCNYGEFDGSANQKTVSRKEVTAAVEATISEQKRKVIKQRIAPDLTEDEIFSINSFLKPENRKDVSPSIAIRDFLMWRLAMEFGIREGEILALRDVDCPHRGQDFIKIVRIEERGTNYVDPRGTKAPRPKTLSRNLGLGFIIASSPVPRLISEYMSEHRKQTVLRLGKKVTTFPNHNFLILNHQKRDNGQPLSVSGMADVAAAIRNGTGIAFHWHLVRHAFFNRTYAATIDHPDRKAKIDDLIYWGGWRSVHSLRNYIRRAQQFRAEHVLCIWQQNPTWEAMQ